MQKKNFPLRLVAILSLAMVSAVRADSPTYQIDTIYAEGVGQDYLGTLTAAGVVTGHTEYNVINNGMNATFWVYSRAAGTQVVPGLTDALHTVPVGLSRYNNYRTVIIADSGEIAGISERYINGIDAGYDTWVTAPSQGQPQLIGILDAEHTSIDGQRYNFPSFINSSGQIVGSIVRFDDVGNTNDVWLFDPASHMTQLIGILDSAHTNIDGTRNSYATAISNSGYVVGSVSRYSAGAYTGQDSWVYNPSTHSALVIALSNYFQSFTDSAAQGVNDAGQVIGTSGGQAWFTNSAGSTAQLIGPSDPAHLTSDGTANSFPLRINSAGQVLGEATRYSAVGLSEIGQDVWYYNPLTNRTEIIGLFDAAHTWGNGRGFNEAYLLNSVGEIAGDAQRADGGVDAWLFDPSSDQTNIIPLPAGDSLGQITGLANDGTVIGYYLTAQNNSIAFSFTESGGLESLAPLVSGGLAAAGWSDLGEPYLINNSGQIAGLGTLANGQAGAYLLTPLSLPEPYSLSLLAAAALLFVRPRATGRIIPLNAGSPPDNSYVPGESNQL